MMQERSMRGLPGLPMLALLVLLPVFAVRGLVVAAGQGSGWMTTFWILVLIADFLAGSDWPWSTPTRPRS